MTELMDVEPVPWVIDTQGDPSLLERKFETKHSEDEIPWVIDPKSSNFMNLDFIIKNLDVLECPICFGSAWEGRVIGTYLHYNKFTYNESLAKLMNKYILAIQAIVNMKQQPMQTENDINILRYHLRKQVAQHYYETLYKISNETNMNKDIYIFIQNYIKNMVNMKYARHLINK